MTFINHYSMLWGGILILGLVAWRMLRKCFKPKDGLILFGLGAGLLVIWLALRPQPAVNLELAQFQAELGSGKAVLLELQSPY